MRNQPLYTKDQIRKSAMDVPNTIQIDKIHPNSNPGGDLPRDLNNVQITPTIGGSKRIQDHRDRTISLPRNAASRSRMSGAAYNSIRHNYVNNVKYDDYAQP